MSRKKVEPDQKARIQVVASIQQGEILTAAADAAGADRSTWMLAHALKAANATTAEGAPIVVGGPVADRLRSRAKAEGVTPDQILEQLLIAGA